LTGYSATVAHTKAAVTVGAVVHTTFGGPAIKLAKTRFSQI